MVVDKVTDNELGERGKRKYQESIPAYQGGGAGQIAQALGKDFG